MENKDLSYKELFELSQKVYHNQLNKAESREQIATKRLEVRDELDRISEESEKDYARANKAAILVSSFIGGLFLGLAYLIGIIVGRGGF